MENSVEELLNSNGEIAFAVIGITQIVKMTGYIPSRLLPLIAVLSGIGLTMGRDGLHFASFLYGLIIGLASTGLVNRVDQYLSGTQTIINNNAVIEESDKADETVQINPEK